MNDDEPCTQLIGHPITKLLENKLFEKRFTAEMSELVSHPASGTSSYTISKGSQPPNETLLKWCRGDEWVWVQRGSLSQESPGFATVFEAFCFLHYTRILELRRQNILAQTITESTQAPPKYEYIFSVGDKQIVKINPSFLELYTIANAIMKHTSLVYQT